MASEPAEHDTGPPDGRFGSSGGGVGDTRAEELYDRYLEAALAGERREPREFLAEAGIADGPGVAELVARLRQIEELVDDAPRREARAGLPFDQLGEFRLLEALGSGAMGVVYLAEQLSLGRVVALKVMREELAGSLSAEQRFEREAKALARIQHPGVVRLFGFGTDGGARFLAMELVPGNSLSELIEERGPLPPVEVAQWGLELAGALARVHNAELLHRDVKPSNIRVHEEGYAVLVDFGLSMARGLDAGAMPAGFAGSVGYASPEQVRGNVELGPTTDVYSLGATLYHALAGRPAFEADSAEALIGAILREEPAPLRALRPQIPSDLATIVQHAMSKDPARRYASAHDLAADFEAVLAFRPIRARRPGPLERLAKWARREPSAAVGAGLATVAVLALVAMVFLIGHFDAVDRSARARDALEEARLAVLQYAADRESMRDLDIELRVLAQDREYRFVTDNERTAYDNLVDRVEEARRRRVGVAYVVGDRLARAQRLDPTLEDEAQAIQQQLLLEKWEDALAEGDSLGARLFEQELRRALPAAELDALPFATTEVTLHSSVPGTELYLFRVDEFDKLVEGAQRRQVSVPIRADGSEIDRTDLPIGSWALRLPRRVDGLAGGFEPLDLLLEVDGRPIEGGAFVVADDPARGLRRGDRILGVNGLPVWDGYDAVLGVQYSAGSSTVEVLRGGRSLELAVESLDGVELLEPRRWLTRFGGPATLWRGGERLAVDVPPGLPWRTTANPNFTVPESRVASGTTVTGLRRGVYQVVAVAPGCEPLRAVLAVDGRETPGAYELAPRPVGFAPPGFVHLVFVQQSGAPDSWVAETETLAHEYLPFLRDPEVAELVEASFEAGEVLRIPRSGGMRTLIWDRDPASGAIELPDDWTPDMPVVGITYDDAQSYVAWRNRSVASGEFYLGHQGDRSSVGASYEGRYFSWGARFDPRFANTCFSRRQAGVEPALSYPVDESLLGVYDLCGNAAELIESWFDEANGYRHAIGGAWGQAPANINRTLGGYGHKPYRSTGETGMRLMWRPEVSP